MNTVDTTRFLKEKHAGGSSTSLSPSRAIEDREGGPTPRLEKLYRGISSPLRLLPDFLIIGAQRSGTTSLYNYLQTHPYIRSSSTKEVHFFDRRFDEGVNWYRAHFPTRIAKAYAQHFRQRAFVTGEASPAYLFYPHAPRRVAQVLPQVKLIVLLRNPVDRAYSQYYHTCELGYETLPFEQAIQAEVARIGSEREKILEDEHYYSDAYKHQSYLSRGIYVDQLQSWLALFPREQFLILKSEEFYADPAATLKQVLAFLKLPEVALPDRKQHYKQYNNTTYARMDSALRQRLLEYFAPHNARLYEFLGMNFDWNT
jgi:hypothetical protein